MYYYIKKIFIYYILVIKNIIDVIYYLNILFDYKNLSIKILLKILKNILIIIILRKEILTFLIN